MVSCDHYSLLDHGGGFDQYLRNPRLDSVRHKPCQVDCEYFVDDRIQSTYPNIQFQFSSFKSELLESFRDYHEHPEQTFQKFLCSFNGSDQVNRKFLTAALHRWGYFNPDTCSKNFKSTQLKIDGHLADYLDPTQHRFYRKFFMTDSSPDFFSQIYSFGYDRFDHAANIYNLADKIAQCFLHVVSETQATSYYPFVTEKFLYSVVTRGLFVAYAPPGWHDHVERYYGFRKYDGIFDYRFDSIENPVERLVELMSMISKFSVLSSDDWRDLYEMQSDTIEYNYAHYFSGRYLNIYKYND